MDEKVTLTEEDIKEISNTVSMLDINLRPEIAEMISPEITDMIFNHNSAVNGYLQNIYSNSLTRLLISKGIISEEEYEGAVYAFLNNDKNNLNGLKEERDEILRFVAEDYIESKKEEEMYNNEMNDISEESSEDFQE